MVLGRSNRATVLREGLPPVALHKQGRARTHILQDKTSQSLAVWWCRLWLTPSVPHCQPPTTQYGSAPSWRKRFFFDSQTQTPAHPQTPEKQQHAQSGACGSCARRWRTSTSNSATLPPAQQRSPRSSKPSACAGSCSLHPLQGDADNALQAAALAAHRRHVTRPGPLAAACGCHALPAKKARRSAPRAAGGATAREGTRGPGAAPPTEGAERTRALAPRLTWLHTRRARGAPSSRLLLAALSEASCAAACTRCAASRSQSSF